MTIENKLCEDGIHEILQLAFYWKDFGGYYGTCICPTEKRGEICGSSIHIDYDLYEHTISGTYVLKEVKE